MSEADKDGRVAQIVADLHTCLSMSIHEGLREAAAGLRELVDDIDED